MNDTCAGMKFTHLNLINAATLRFESRKTENACEHNVSF